MSHELDIEKKKLPWEEKNNDLMIIFLLHQIAKYQPVYKGISVLDFKLENYLHPLH